MQYLGTLKRRMYLGRIGSEAALSPGTELFSGSDASQAIGRLIDAEPHPDGGQLALAVLRIESADNSDVFVGSPTGPAFDLEQLPYPFEAD